MGPFNVRYEGSDVVYSIDASHPGYEQYRADADELAANLPKHIDACRERVQGLLAGTDAFDVLGYLHTAAKHPDHAEGPILALTELAATVLIERPARRVDGEEPAELDLFALLGELEDLQRFLTRQAFGTERTATDDLATIRSRALGLRTTLRAPHYEWQERETLVDFFGPPHIDALLVQHLGCGIQDVLSIEEAIGRVGGERMVRHAERLEAMRRELAEACDALRAGKSVSNPRTRALAEHLVGMPRERADRWLSAIAGVPLTADMGDRLSFSVDEIAECSGVAKDAVERFLGAFSLPFGTVSKFTLDIERFRERPLLVDADGRYLPVSTALLLFALRPKFEELLNQADRKQFESYERHRKRRVEERALAALSAALQPDEAGSGLFYDAHEEGVAKRPEVDGLLRLDDVLFIVEVKASSMRAPERRAAPKSFKEWMEEEVGGAARQARRARQALAADTPSVLYDAKQNPVSFNLKKVRRSFEIVVTLESLPGVIPSTWALADAGLIPSAPVPWVVGLHELETLCSLVERPAQLVHYLLRRRRVDEQRRFWAMEELDFFMHYLREGLWWAEAPATIGSAVLGSQTDPLDRYLQQVQLGDKRAKRPKQKLHRAVRELLDTTDASNQPGRISAQLAVLEPDTRDAVRIATSARRLGKHAAREGRIRDETSPFEDASFGVTVMGIPPAQAGQQRLLAYCQLKKYQAKADTWVGFAAWEGPPEIVQQVVVLDQPWEFDERWEKLVAELPTSKTGPPPASNGGKRIRLWDRGTWR